MSPSSDWNDLHEVELGALRPPRETEGGEPPAAAPAEGGERPESTGPKATGGPRRGLLRRIFDRFRRRPAAREEPPTTKPSPPAWSYDAPSRELVGLALSGGGIRSATFNLGVLQKLDALGVLSAIDYLSTVSGGGYVGGFWSAWRARRSEDQGTFPYRWEGEAEPPEIRHLREFSNFLRPRLRLLSAETGRMATSVVAAVIPTVIVSLTILALGLLAWLGVGWLLLADVPADQFPWPLRPPLAIFGATLLVQAAFELLWHWGHEEKDTATGVLAFWAIASALATAGAWAFLWHLTPQPFGALLQPLPAGEELGLVAFTILLPTAAWTAGMALLVLVRVLTSRANRSWRARTRKGALDRALSRLLLCVGAWAVAGLVWIVAQLVAAEGVAGLATLAGSGGVAGGAFSWLRRLFGKQPNKPMGGKVGLQIGSWMMAALAYVALAAVAATVATLLIQIATALGPGSLWIIAAGGVAIVALAILTFDPHENGFHAFYRARLVRAFLGASNGDGGREATLECEHDDLSITDLPARPLHLVCCAANDLAADPLGTLHRGAESAVLSPLGLQVGGHWRSWSSGLRPPSLGAALTASAAAFNSHMGGLSMRLGQAATFLLAALNLRLGLWVENPGRPSYLLADLWTKLQRHLPGLLYLRELAGASRSESTWIHLSDGGHFENLALYELVRRHCRCILLCDCGADPDVAFDDFGNAVRRIREDFGVEIEIDLTPLRPGDDGLAGQPMVAGDIRYPTGDLGVLLYLKPTLTGSEPPDVAQYARRNEAFPHETTLDQFYDEAQWEAYRRLGEHVAEQALGGLLGRVRPEQSRAADERVSLSPEEVLRLFLYARYAWPPGGSDDRPLAVAIEREWTELENRLEQPAFAALRRELLPVSQGATKAAKEDPTQTLPAVRDALRLMETVILHLGMGATPTAPSHPLYMGWLNRFGRWASTPSFRAWWPWLAPLHSRTATDFLVDTFDLPPVADPASQVRKIGQRGRSGFTWMRWREHRDAQPSREQAGSATDLFGLFLPRVAGGPRLLAGVVEVESCGGGEEAAWSLERFFIPPGLWGVGLGEELLRKLVARLRRDGVRRLCVETSERSTMAWDALYTGAGFLRQGPSLVLDFETPGPATDTHTHTDTDTE